MRDISGGLAAAGDGRGGGAMVGGTAKLDIALWCVISFIVSSKRERNKRGSSPRACAASEKARQGRAMTGLGFSSSATSRAPRAAASCRMSIDMCVSPKRTSARALRVQSSSEEADQAASVWEEMGKSRNLAGAEVEREDGELGEDDGDGV